MACPFSNSGGISPHVNASNNINSGEAHPCSQPLFLHTLTDDTPYPFTNPEETKKDQAVMRQTLSRLLHSLKNVQRKRRLSFSLDSREEASKKPTLSTSPPSTHAPPLSTLASPPSPPSPTTPDEASARMATGLTVKNNKLNYIFHLSNLSGNDKALRCIICDVDKFFSHPKFFVIGFFSKTIKNSPVLDKICAYDEKMVVCLPNFPSILCYVTCMKTDEEYFNLVFLENAEAVDKWRKFQFHDKAVATSARYYEWVRIHNAQLPFNIQSLLAREERQKNLEIIRTKYFLFEDGAMTWKGVRSFMVDEVFASSPSLYHIAAKPFIVASFLGANAFKFYKDIVQRLGASTGLPFQMIDIASLTEGQTPRPTDLASISKFHIDFAFTSGASARYYPNLLPLVAPVRSNSRYNNKPIYYCDFVVRTDSPYQTVEDLKGKICAISESNSFCGYHFPQYYFNKLGYKQMEEYFGDITVSGSHLNSLKLLENGVVDCTPINSVVLETEFQQNPQRKANMRVISSYGPATMSPVVSAVWVSEAVRRVVTKVFKNLHKTEKDFLEEHGFLRFDPVHESDYEVIRNMLPPPSTPSSPPLMEL